ncbi:glycosyltransferase [Sphingomonas aerolata]|uniref:glycosyltransferase n=1 Tax=Sphingomonas aerolata TaxID=185951 RepID=UPI002FE29400
MRYLWDHYHQHRGSAGRLTRLMMTLLFGRLRHWDMTSAARIDIVVANPQFIKKRIAKAWRRDAVVVHPPVDTSLFTPAAVVGDEYLWVGQMTPYKRADLAVEAFNALQLPLLMVGDGEMAAELRRRAGPTIRIILRMRFDELRHAYATSKALIFTPEEDFGIVPVEMMASGRPVLAYARGGIRDSLVERKTGLFFERQTIESLIDGVRAMEAWLPEFDPADAVAQAEQFALEHFDAGILAALEHDAPQGLDRGDQRGVRGRRQRAAAARGPPMRLGVQTHFSQNSACRMGRSSDRRRRRVVARSASLGFGRTASGQICGRG